MMLELLKKKYEQQRNRNFALEKSFIELRKEVYESRMMEITEKMQQVRRQKKVMEEEKQ